MTRRELIEYCLMLPFAYEDYPFDDIIDASAWTVMRHRTNRKGFAHIYERNRKLCINLKCDPFEADLLRQIFTDITPAYHMNKVHWNTIMLGGDVPKDELRRLIEHSYDLTKPKHRRTKMKLIVNKDKCPQNHKCPSIAVCPQGAISQTDIYALPEIDGEKCVLCGKCMEYCPKGAFEKV